MIGNLLITINRYSALCLMNIYNEIWTRKHVLAAIIFQYVISIGVFAHAIRAHVEYIPGANGTTIIKGIKEREIDLRLLFYALVIFSGSMLVCIQQFVKFVAVITNDISLNLWATLQVGLV
nr:unnamed protein product [Haemonchus contortus]